MAGDKTVKRHIEMATIQWMSGEKVTPASQFQDVISFAETKPSPIQITESESPVEKTLPLIEETVYPKGLKLALITLALCLAVFLFALVRPPIRS
jgi:hypothetical protein